MTWNTQPSILATHESSIAPATSNVYWEWDITKLSQDWYSSLQANYGLLLKNNNESSTTPYGYFGASENIPAYIPKMTITYTVVPIGTEDFWYQTQEGVNPSNGNLTITESDFVFRIQRVGR
ncbi:MAG TPA: DNRLRE domain-containing protein [Bacillales bacterium]|nr:DNRLRE domain-containing protein [Bacillales bacterium]